MLASKKETIKRDIRKVILRYAGYHPNFRIVDGTEFKRHLKFDCLDMIQLIMHCEVFFEIQISDSEMEKVCNFEQFCDVILKQLE